VRENELVEKYTHLTRWNKKKRRKKKPERKRETGRGTFKSKQ